MKLKYAFQRGVASALIAGVVLTAGLPALETAKTESVAVVQVASPSDEGAAQDESGVAAAIISEDDTPLSIPDEETPPSGNAGTGFWSILFQLLKHLAGKH